jgi:hypothetical protein
MDILAGALVAALAAALLLFHATDSAAAGSRQASPYDLAAPPGDVSANEALRHTLNTSPVEYSHDGGDGRDVQDSVRRSILRLDGQDWGHGDSFFWPGDEMLVERDSLFGPGDEVLVDRKLWRAARTMPLAERRSKRYSKLQSFVE